MTDKAISPLRQRMIEDMTIRKLAPKTQHDYVQRIKNFAAFLGAAGRPEPLRPLADLGHAGRGMAGARRRVCAADVWDQNCSRCSQKLAPGFFFWQSGIFHHYDEAARLLEPHC